MLGLLVKERTSVEIMAKASMLRAASKPAVGKPDTEGLWKKGGKPR